MNWSEEMPEKSGQKAALPPAPARIRTQWLMLGAGHPDAAHHTVAFTKGNIGAPVTAAAWPYCVAAMSMAWFLTVTTASL